MIYPIISIRDNLVGFGAPQTTINIEVALRQFKNICKESPNGNDLELWEIGEFDDELGTVKAFEPTQLILRGNSLRKENAK